MRIGTKSILETKILVLLTQPAPASPPETPTQTDEQAKDTEPPKEEVVEEPKAPAAPLSWADLASKNTPARGNTQQGTVVKMHQVRSCASLGKFTPRTRALNEATSCVRRVAAGSCSFLLVIAARLV